MIKRQRYFKKRKDRSLFVFEEFGSLFNSSILDVGCYQAELKKMIAEPNSYTGIDIVGCPDVYVNLEEIDCLPFEDQSFETVLCTEVLEHLGNFHLIMNDLFRVASKNVLISLPNCWASARKPIRSGKGTIAHYGLPFSNPVDRHKWFFSCNEAIEFFCNYERSNPGVKSLKLLCVEKPRHKFVRLLRRLSTTNSAYLNKYVHTVFAHFVI